jgi:hypothetical protein
VSDWEPELDYTGSPVLDALGDVKYIAPCEDSNECNGWTCECAMRNQNG